MVGMENLVPQWFKHGEYDMGEYGPYVPAPPPIAALPEPAPPRGETEAERAARIFGEAAVLNDKIRRQIEVEAVRTAALEAELSETRKELEAERRKSGLLELELAEALNNLQATEADRVAFQETQQRILSAIDKHGTKRPAKKNGNGRKTNE